MGHAKACSDPRVIDRDKTHRERRPTCLGQPNLLGLGAWDDGRQARLEWWQQSCSGPRSHYLHFVGVGHCNPILKAELRPGHGWSSQPGNLRRATMTANGDVRSSRTAMKLHVKKIAIAKNASGSSAGSNQTPAGGHPATSSGAESGLLGQGRRRGGRNSGKWFRLAPVKIKRTPTAPTPPQPGQKLSWTLIKIVPHPTTTTILEINSRDPAH